MIFTHEAMGPGLHQFRFPSRSERGVTHILTLDFDVEGPGRLLCSCPAGVFGKLCKHARFLLNGPAGVRA